MHEMYDMQEVVGKFIEGKDELENPGDFIYYVGCRSQRKDKIVGMIFICPCGCGERVEISFGPRTGYRQVWTWDGNLRRPTLVPKLFCLQISCNWHGHLLNGIFTPLKERHRYLKPELLRGNIQYDH